MKELIDFLVFAHDFNYTQTVEGAEHIPYIITFLVGMVVVSSQFIGYWSSLEDKTELKVRTAIILPQYLIVIGSMQVLGLWHWLVCVLSIIIYCGIMYEKRKAFVDYVTEREAHKRKIHDYKKLYDKYLNKYNA